MVQRLLPTQSRRWRKICMNITKIIKWLLFMSLLVGAVIFIREANEFIEIDRCLDSGSAWDYENGSCLNQSNQG